MAMEDRSTGWSPSRDRGLWPWSPPAPSRTLGLTPNGDSPEFITNHPLLKGHDIPTTGRPGHAIMLPTRTLLLTAPPGLPVLYALDKATGSVSVP